MSGTTVRVSVSSAGGDADALSQSQGISADGQYVVFASAATNIVSGDTNGHWDVFERNMATGVTQRVSLSATGAQGVHDAANESVSADGNLVAFRSGFTEDGSDFQVYVRNIAAGTTTMASVSSGGTPQNGGLLNPNPISDDGTHVTFQPRPPTWA